MAENKKANKKNDWDKVQKIGFWSLIIVSVAFWGGVYAGFTSANETSKKIEITKAQAIEEYKASQAALKPSEQ